MDIAEQDIEEMGCCESTSCDCTCCIHLPLFSFGIHEFSFSSAVAKDSHHFVHGYEHANHFSIFHPPAVFS